MADQAGQKELPKGPANIGPDGETIDMSFYELLSVRGDASDLELKKAYRKLAIKWHPDKNPGDEAAKERWLEMSEAYGVLSDPNLRAVYNKQGKKQAVSSADEEFMQDPGAIFGQLFGGKAFMDWIGEISLGKDVSKAFEVGTTEEEKEAMKAEARGRAGVSPSPAASQANITADAPPAAAATGSVPLAAAGTGAAAASPQVGSTAPAAGVAASPSLGSTPGTSTPPTGPSIATGAEPPAGLPDKPGKMTPEQRAQMLAYEKERAAEKKARITTLAQQLKDRIRPFVQASNPGDAKDPETIRYAERIKEETQDLAMESFGVEICQLIGQIYMTKANNYIKLHRKAGANLLGVPGWWSRVKEKGTMIKEGWSFLSVGLDVQSAMADLEKRQAAGEAMTEEEMAEAEKELSGKMLLVSWKGTRFELATILRQVVDLVLVRDGTVPDAELMNRAKAILLTGAILSAVQPDESDAERRELERIVAEANRKRKEKMGKIPKQKPEEVKSAEKVKA